MIEKSSIESLKNSIDIVDVVSSFIELKKAGANYKANCPFHGEKTASFVVSPQKQIYHCFGCGVGGDSITFVMELEKLSYPESIEKLASMFNFTLNYEKGSSNYSEAKRVLTIMGEWYRKNLNQNQIAINYLLSRGISQNSIEIFEIGFAPKSLQIMNFLNQSLLPLPQVVEAGVIAQSDNGKGYYGRLVERIIFPIYSASSSIVGFGGRTITNHPAKYINSPQTKLFNKSRLLYGYNLAKDSIYKNKKIIICEGYLDVIMLHQAGFKEAVASMGTALTSEHLPILRKGNPKIILAYDGDKAGVSAGVKASEMLSIAGFDGGVVLFPDSFDPADLIANGETDKVAKLFREAKSFIPFVLEMIVSPYNLYNPIEKEEVFGLFKEYLNKLSDIIKESYIPIAATLLGVPISFFNENKITPTIPNNSKKEVKHDTGLLSIIKTIMENRSLIDKVLDLIDIGLFGRYIPLVIAIRDKKEHPSLVRLSLDENITIINEDALNSTLKNFLIKSYRLRLKNIANSTDISYSKKSFLIRKIKTDIIPRLNSGELIAYKALNY